MAKKKNNILADFVDGFKKALNNQQQQQTQQQTTQQLPTKNTWQQAQQKREAVANSILSPNRTNMMATATTAEKLKNKGSFLNGLNLPTRTISQKETINNGMQRAVDIRNSTPEEERKKEEEQIRKQEQLKQQQNNNNNDYQVGGTFKNVVNQASKEEQKETKTGETIEKKETNLPTNINSKIFNAQNLQEAENDVEKRFLSTMENVTNATENTLLGAAKGLKDAGDFTVHLANYPYDKARQLGFNIGSKLSGKTYKDDGDYSQLGIIDKALPEDSKFRPAVNKLVETKSNVLGKINKKSTDIDTYLNTNIAQNIEETNDPIAKKITEIAPSIGQQLPATVLGPEYFFLSSGGSYYKDALTRGMNKDQATIFGVVMGTVEGLTEKIQFGKLANTGKNIMSGGTIKQAFKDYGLNVADNMVQEGITEPITEFAAQTIGGKDKADWNNIGKRMWEAAVDGGISSVIMDAGFSGVSSANRIIEKMENNEKISNEELKETLQDIQASGKVDINQSLQNSFNKVTNSIRDALYSKGIDSTSALNKARNIDEAYKTNLTSEIKKALNDGKLNKDTYSELNKQLDQISQLKNSEELLNRAKDLDDTLELTDTDNSLSNVVEKLTSEAKLDNETYDKLKGIFDNIDNNMPYVAETSENKKIDTFRDDMTNFMNNSVQSHNFAKSVESIIEKTGLNIRLNNQLADNENGRIFNENGETTIEINPNSQSAGEFVLMHELTHAIGNQDLKQTILDYANKNKEFEAALKDLEARYGQDDVTEEVMADISGQLLGNEEFINSLAQEQPSKFKQIYNAVKSWVKKFTGTYGYEDFVRDVEIKWRKAYEQNKNSITENIDHKILNNKTTLEEIPLFSKSANNNENNSDSFNLPKNISIKDSQGREIDHDIHTYSTAAYSDQVNMVKEFQDEDGNTISKIDYSIYNGDIYIDYIETQPEYRRKGLAKRLLLDLQQDAKEENQKIHYGYSSEEGTAFLKSIEESNRTAAADSYSPQTDNQGRTLLAEHNLTEDKLKSILELGGFPVPSIAITNPNKVSHDQFGDITVVFDKNTIDPANKLNEVYDRDVWSPTFPEVDYEINDTNLDKIADNIGVESWRLDDYAKDSKNPKQLVEQLLRRDEIIDKYIKDNNLKYDTQYKEANITKWYNKEDSIKNFIKNNNLSLEVLQNNEKIRNEYFEELRKEFNKDNDEKEAIEKTIEKLKDLIYMKNLDRLQNLGKDFDIITTGETKEVDDYETRKEKKRVAIENGIEKYLSDITNELFGEKGIYNGKEIFTPSGNRRSFWSLHDEYNLENIVEALTNQDTKATQSSFMTGFGKINAQMAKQFNSIEDIKANSDRIMKDIDNSKLEEYRDIIGDDISELAEYYKYASEDNFGMQGFTNASDSIFDLAKSQDLTEDNFRKILNENIMNGEKVPKKIIDKVINDLSNLKNLSTDYFEAKPQRAVGLDEVKAVVVPNSINPELKQELIDKGMNVIEYDPNIEGDRQAKISSLDKYKFSKTTDKWQDFLNKYFPSRGTTNNLSEMKQILPTKDQVSNNKSLDYITDKISKGLKEIYPVELTDEEIKNITENIVKNPTEKGILNALKDYRTTYIEDESSDNNTIKEIKSTIRNTKLDLSNLKRNITDYNDTRKANFGKLKLGNDGLSVDSFYQELSNNYPEYFDKEIANEADQLNAIIDFINQDYETKTEYQMTDEDVKASGVVDAIQEMLANNKEILPTKQAIETKKQQNTPKTEEIAPLRTTEQIANDNNISDIEAMKEETEQVNIPSKKIAEQVEKELASRDIEKSPTIDYIKEKRSKEKTTFKQIKDELAQKFVNKGHYIDKLAKQTKNEKLTWLYDRTMNSFNEAQISIGDQQINSNGEVVGKSIIDIFKPAEEKKLTKEFNDYLLNKHNIARYGYEKGVFGTEVSAEQSKQIVDYYEKKYPEFKEWGEEASKYNDNNLIDLVDNGLVSDEMYKKLRNMYPDYVPTFRDITDDMSNFTVDDRVGTNTLKKATGSNLDILSVQESMAEQTLAIKKAIRMNNLGLELYNTLHPSKSDIILSGVEFDPSAMMTLNGDVVDRDTDGTNMYTIFDNGEMKTFKISDELYSAFKKDTLQNKIKNSKAAKALLTPLEKLSKAQRALLTTYSIGFSLNNPIKDFSNALVNTKYSDLKFIKNYPKALFNLATKGEWYKSYKNNGGYANTYFDYDKGLLPTKTKNPIKKFANKIATVNEILEQAPRLTEYISTIENGGTIDEALYNAADVTVNFKRGGDITKAINKYGANFLNASVQGLDKAYRNITGQNGVKGYTRLMVNATIASIAPAIINNLVLGDDDDYEELPDYIKDNYFLFKIGDNKFFRIPKGNVSSVIGSIARRANDVAEGKEVNWKSLVDTVVNQLAPNNPVTDNVLAPVMQVKNNKAWYGGDIVSTRLQKLPEAEQYDEKTDSISKFLGKTLNLSPKKINYLLDQYTGGIGDVVLPMLTPQAENNILEDKFTTNSVMKSKYPSEFFTKSDELQIASNSENATDEDKLRYLLMNELKSGKNFKIDGKTISTGISDLYAEKRAIQNSSVSDSEKKEELQKVQEKINTLAKYGVESSDKIEIKNNIAYIPNTDFKWIKENGSWKKIDDKTKTKLKQNNISLESYANYQDKVAKAKTNLKSDESLKQADKIKILKNMNISSKDKKGLYSAFVGSTDTDYEAVKNVIKIDDYLDYKSQNFVADKDANGKSISGTRKQKIIDYLNKKNMTYEQKLIILGMNNKLTSSELAEVFNYINSQKLTAKQKLAILEQVKGFKINGNNISW